MKPVTRITKHAEKRRVDQLYRRVERLEALLAKRKAELVARKRQYDGDGSLWWVSFWSPAGATGLDVVTFASDESEAAENCLARWPDEHGDPIVFRLSKPWPGKMNDPLDDDEVVAVAKLAEA